jgi:hypothetical protein
MIPDPHATFLQAALPELGTKRSGPDLRVNRAAEEAAVGYLDEISGGAAGANRYASPR